MHKTKQNSLTPAPTPAPAATLGSNLFILDRPQAANALDLATAKRIHLQLKKAAQDGHRGFIISSASSRVFCGGGDLQSYAAMKSKKEGVQANRLIRKILQDFKKSPLIIVAAIEGDCVGGGCELALACDHIIAGEAARFAFRQGAMGLTFGWGGGEALSKRVSLGSGIKWLTSGQWITASEAGRTGLVDQVTPCGRALERASSFVGDLPLDPGLVLKLKELLWGGSKAKDAARVFERLWHSAGHKKALEKALKSLGKN